MLLLTKGAVSCSATRGAVRLAGFVGPWCVLALAALAGCAKERPVLTEKSPSEEFSVALLARRPDVVVEQEGRLSPSTEDGFGLRSLGGWERRALERPGWPPHLWSSAAHCSLELTALGPGARTIVLEGWRTPEGPESVALELNGTAIGDALFQRQNGEVSIETPAEAWRAGRNRLTLMGAGRYAPAQRRFALASVRYDDVRSVEANLSGGAPTLDLEAGCSVLYRVAQGLGKSLSLSARASEAGTLLVSFERLDPRSGRVEELGGESRHSVEADDVALRLALPGGPSASVLGIRLAWESPSAAALHLSRVDLVGARERPRPPIVFISIDTLAARNMSLYGYPRTTTPQLERFAESAVTFERCKANAPWTEPSYASQMTGLLAEALLEPRRGRTLNETEGKLAYVVPSGRWTLAEAVRSAGYATAAFVDNPHLRAYGFRQGFDAYNDRATYISTLDPYGGMRYCFPRALDWIDERGPDTPYLAFVQILDCHGPYVPNEPWEDRFSGDALAQRPPWPVRVSEFNETVFGAMMVSSAGTLVPEGAPIPDKLDAERMRRAYDEQLAEVDAEVGAFLDQLRARPDYDELVIVITADHGESMTEHGEFFSHTTLHEPVLHVPLLVRLPGDEFGGTRIAEPVELVDLYATFAEFAGVPGLAEHTHGHSLLPLMKGEASTARELSASSAFLSQRSIEIDGWKLVTMAPQEREYRSSLTHPAIVAELGEVLAAGLGVPSWPPAGWYRAGYAEKFVIDDPAGALSVLQTIERRSPWVALYHLDEDPGELNDLAAEEPERVATMLKRLEVREALMAAAALDVPDDASEAGAGPGDWAGDLDLEELQRLGYVDTPPDSPGSLSGDGESE